AGQKEHPVSRVGDAIVQELDAFERKPQVRGIAGAADVPDAVGDVRAYGNDRRQNVDELQHEIQREHQRISTVAVPTVVRGPSSFSPQISSSTSGPSTRLTRPRHRYV